MMKELGLVIEHLLRQKKMWKQYRQHLIIESWSELMGINIASVTRAERISKGILFIVVKDSTWAYHLTLLKAQLSEKINSYFGYRVVTEIYFQVGDLHREGNKYFGNNNLLQGNLISNNNQSIFIEGIRKLRHLQSDASTLFSEGE